MVREKVDNYLKENKGATEKVMDKLGSLLES
jgi:hypothetical protein